MTQKTWNRLSFFEQLSNIDGEVNRLVQVHEKYKSGICEQDYSNEYLAKIIALIRMTMFDPKNTVKGYRSIELFDEVEELKRYINNEVTKEYIQSYWNEYTKAIS